jgi:hypothetical protein
MAAEERVRGRDADRQMEEAGVRKTVLFEVCADEGDEFLKYVYLQGAEGGAEGGRCRGGRRWRGAVCELWV